MSGRARVVVCWLAVLALLGAVGFVCVALWVGRSDPRGDFYARVDRLIASGCYADAVGLLERAAPARTGQTEYALRLGICQSMLGRYALAVQTFEQALSVAPAEPRLLYNRALVEVRRGRDDEALVRLERLAELAPYFPGVQYHIGRIYERRGEPDQALVHYVKELNINPANPAAQQRFLYLKRKARQGDAP